MQRDDRRFAAEDHGDLVAAEVGVLRRQGRADRQIRIKLRRRRLALLRYGRVFARLRAREFRRFGERLGMPLSE